MAQSTYELYSIKDQIEFENTATGDFETLSWNFGDGIVSTEVNPKHTYLREGSYTIARTVKYFFGCSYVYSSKLQ